MANVAFFQPLMDETMALLLEARQYVAEKAEGETRLLPIDQGLTASVESMRIVARLTQVMAWVLTQRAVSNHEITDREALEPERRLGGADLCAIDTTSYDHLLPAELRSLLRRSYDLYQRVARMDFLAEQRFKGQEAIAHGG